MDQNIALFIFQEKGSVYFENRVKGCVIRISIKGGESNLPNIFHFNLYFYILFELIMHF